MWVLSEPVTVIGQECLTNQQDSHNPANVKGFYPSTGRQAQTCLGEVLPITRERTVGRGSERSEKPDILEVHNHVNVGFLDSCGAYGTQPTFLYEMFLARSKQV